MTQLSIAQKVDDKLYKRGTTYLNAGDYEKAVKNFNKSIEKNDKFIDAYFNRALSYTYLKKYDEAINDYSIIIKLDPNNEVSFFNRSRIFNLKKEYQKAISDLNSAIKIDKKFIEVYFDKAQIMIKMKDLNGAISTYTNLIEVLPNDPIPYYNRGLIKYRNGDKKGACEDAALSKSKYIACDINLYDPLKKLIENSCDEKQKEVLLSDKQDKVVPFGIIEEVPVYPGCEKVPKSELRKCFQEQIQRHIARNFRYPKEAQKRNIQGRVFVQFMIAKEGCVTAIRTRGPHPLLESEARRIISLLPRISPGLSDGEKVNVPFSIPIIFKLQ
tara:strand:- start:4040 stop:5023 length:984 start_codon:yes stop_codon:yes gene_type:complete